MKNAVNGLEEERDKLFNFRPCLFAAFFLVLGITFAYIRIVHGASYLWLLAFLPAFALLLVFSENWKAVGARLAAALLLFFFFCLGGNCFYAQIEDFQALPVYEGNYLVVGEVESKRTSDEWTELVLTDTYIGEDKVEGRVSAILALYRAEKVKVGDKVLLRGEISTDLSLIGKYGFKSTEITKKSCYALKTEGVCTRIDRSKDGFLLTRARVEEVVYAGMDETPAALTLALLTGDIGGVDSELMQNMRYGGIAHVFAVSGLNVGALFGCCLFLYAKTPLRSVPKSARFLLLVGVLFFYSGICGFSASVVRAAITCAVCYFARLFGVGNDLLNALGFAAILILLLSPAELMGVGFQLSFLACLGLFLLAKPINRLFDGVAIAYRRRFPRRYTAEQEKLLAEGDTLPPSMGTLAWRGVSGLLSASIAAQVATLPALLFHFGYVSGWSLLLNFLFVPITDGLFTVLLPLVGVACLLPTAFSGILLYPPSLVWSAAILVFEWADFSSFALSDLQFSFAVCVCYYGGILLSTDKLNISVRARKICALALWLTFAVGVHLGNL